MYYNRPYFELIFLTHSEHLKLHKEGTHRSDDIKRKISESLKGENHPFYGKHLSAEHRQKLSEANKGKHNKDMKGKPFTAEHRQKLSEAAKRRWLRQE